MRTITIGNKKGGVAKTTTAVNCSYCWGMTGRKVIHIDVDPQANSTRSFGITPDSYEISLYHLLMDQIRQMLGRKREYRVKDAIIKTDFGVDIIPCDDRISDIPVWLYENAPSYKGQEIKYLWENKFPFFIKNIMDEISPKYEWAFIDTPPNFEYFTKSALLASDYVIVPVELGDLEITGLEEFVSKLSDFQETHYPELAILGILFTKYEARTKLEKSLEKQMREHPLMGDYIFNTVIYKNVAIKEASVLMKPGGSYKRKGTKDIHGNFADFLEEVLLWIKKREEN